MKTKYLLSSVAVIAALTLSAPAWTQPANPSGGNSMGMPGPGPATAPSASGEHGRMPAGGKKTSTRGGYIPSTPSASDTTSATPPKHHQARAHHVMSTHEMLHAHGPKSGTDTTAQLNQAELARLQSGAPPMAPQMAPPPSAPGGNSMGMSGPNAGGPGLTPYSAGAPPR